ncbi:MAG TPA: IclR family transcriptional regulator [Chloroflexota bacterium]|nr:IclR family transcriptional regulator [Chloroflexota bacterium]
MPEHAARGSEVQSVDRAVSVLELLARQGWSGVTDVANALDMHKSTAYRMLATLKARGLVEQDAETERYRLGWGLVVLARGVMAELDVVRASRSVTERLSVETRETVTISVLAGDEVVVIDQTVASPSVLNVSWTGRHFPLHCTSDGKVWLAHLPASRRRTILAGRLRRCTENTITERARLDEQLDAIRLDGYGFSIAELEVGLVAVAAPIVSTGGSIVATLGVSGPTFRLPAESIPELGELTKRAAAEISRTLGFRRVTDERSNVRSA